MSQQSSESIKEHLEKKDVQNRVRESMRNARDNVTVTISRAAGLFGFTEAQLREWERRGLLKTERPFTSQDGRSTTGHRQYTADELDKLALIRELMNQGYTPGEIPFDVDRLWRSLVVEQQVQPIQEVVPVVKNTVSLPLDKRIEQANQEIFWRYFVSQALRLSLMLLCEDIPDTVAALVLPLQKKDAYKYVTFPADLKNIGETLIGWLSENRSFYTFLDSAPTFEFSSDFRVEQLAITEEDKRQENTVIVLQRRANPLLLNETLVKAVRRLLHPIYESVNEWHACFGYGMRDWMYQVVDFSRPNPYDKVLDGLANMVVQLGGKTADGKDKWRFCCILLPEDASLPLQQRSLILRAQSTNSPHMLGRTIVLPNDTSLSLKAFQSGHVIYRPEISPEDTIIAYHDKEEPIGSAIAIPIGGEDGLSIAVLYIISEEPGAFSEDDQRLLRIISRMVEELLQTYQARQQATGRITDIITRPNIVDTSFKDFQSEDEFISDLEAILIPLKEKMGKWDEPVRLPPLPSLERAAHFWEDQKSGVVSIIAIDIDDQSSRAKRYGDQVTRNLAREVGKRIQENLAALEKFSSRKLYHVYADRFYLLLDGIPLDEARSLAEQLRLRLRGSYSFYARGMTTERPVPRDSLLELSNITVRMAVSAYTYLKLEELLKRYPASEAVPLVRNLIADPIDSLLKEGQRRGGDVVISWNPELWTYTRWLPPVDV